MPTRLPPVLCLLTTLVAGCAMSRADAIPPASGVDSRPPAAPRPPAGDTTPGMADPASREAASHAGGPAASSPGGPNPQPGSTAGGTGDTRGLVRSGSPD